MTEIADGGTIQPSTLLVFEHGAWLETVPGGVDPMPTVEPTSIAGSCDHPIEMMPEGTVVLLGPTVLLHDGHQLSAWDGANNERVTIDHLDIRALRGHGSYSAADRIEDVPDLAARLPRLERAGLVRFDGELRDRTVAAVEDVEIIEEATAEDKDVPPTSEGLLGNSWRLLGRLYRRIAAQNGDAAPAVAASPTLEPVPVSPTLQADEPRVGDLPEATKPEATKPQATRLIADALFDLNDERIPVVATWDIVTWGQPLALGGLLAYAKVHDDGILNERYQFLPVVDHVELLDVLRLLDRPTIVLFSDYIWSAVRNRELVVDVKALDSRHLTLHGGPHVPRFERDKRTFFAANPSIDAIAHGEGEMTLADMLVRIDGATTDMLALTSVAGLTVKVGDHLTATPERERIEDLGMLPSPYLSGEFDHLTTEGWLWPSLETNRGCPYSCTFCDWGSATRSRVRDFPIDRVFQELDWLGDHGLAHWMVNDANFGIHRRDVEIAAHVVALRERLGVPNALYVNYAKNTVKYLAQIIAMLTEAGITGEGALALQTRDEETLRAIKRSNIRTEKYDELAEEFRRYGLPLVTDLIIGLPGQTVSSLLGDMQYCFDNEVTPRFFVALNLPGAEMNDPEYRSKFGLVLGDGDIVVQSNSFSRADRERMMRLRKAFRTLEHFGILRQVFHLLQWDYGVLFSTALDRVEAAVHDHPERYPLLSWVLGYLDVLLIVPYGWKPFYEEVRQLLLDEFDVSGTDVETVLEIQEMVMPRRNRDFPAKVEMQHDYESWYTAHFGGADAPTLLSQPPGCFTVLGDPTWRCRDTIVRVVDERPHELITNAFWAAYHWELDSLLQRLVPETAVSEASKRRRARGEDRPQERSEAAVEIG